MRIAPPSERRRKSILKKTTSDIAKLHQIAQTEHANGELVGLLHGAEHALRDDPDEVLPGEVQVGGGGQDVGGLLARGVQQHHARLARHQLVQLRRALHHHRVQDRQLEPVLVMIIHFKVY